MKGVRFYLEFPTPQARKKSGKTHKGHDGNVFAVFLDDQNQPLSYNSGGTWCWEGLGAIFHGPNSPVAVTGVSVDKVLRKQYKRISETLARTIHPELFTRLDREDKNES